MRDKREITDALPCHAWLIMCMAATTAALWGHVRTDATTTSYWSVYTVCLKKPDRYN